MRTLTLGEVARACGGQLHHADEHQTVTGVSTDSRKTQVGELFLALKGDRFDAHQFMSSDMVSQITGAILTQSMLPQGLPTFPMIDVPDVRKAMGRLAHWYRMQFDLPVIGITGSNGKTSTKALLKSALARGQSVLTSPASFNNDVGVPLTLLEMSDEHQAAILEIGTNHPGEIAHLTQMVKPSIGIITSVGGSHIGHFGTIEAVVQEKGSLAEALPEDGVLFLNSDSSWCTSLAERTCAKVISVGFHEGSDWLLSECRISQSQTTCHIYHKEQRINTNFEIPVSGEHQAVNAGLAFAAAFELGVHPDQIKEGLANAEMPGMRMEVVETPVATLWNDAYNANEDSILASMETFSSVVKQEGRSIVVLGQLNELGDHAKAVYERLARKAVVLGFDLLVGIGEGTDDWISMAQSQGHPKCLHFDSIEEAFLKLQQQILESDHILFKASRGAKLERLVERLKEEFDTKSGIRPGNSTESRISGRSIQPSACLAASAGGLFL